MIHQAAKWVSPEGHHSFSPSRLTVARQSHGYTKKYVADQTGLTAAAVTQFEAGNNGPNLDTVYDIAAVLDFSPEFFYGSEFNLISDASLTFRSRRSMTSALRAKAAAAAILVEGLLSPAVREKFRLPQPEIPDLSEHAPEDAASLLRYQWHMGYGPILNMVHLLESRGVEVYWVCEEASSVDAFSWWENDRPFIILNSAKPSGDRGRFDAAHELAHLVLHRKEKDLDSRKTEAEADRFAAAFLLPADQFSKESPVQPVLEHFRPLKKRWGVSLAAMIRRSRDTGIFTEWQYERACKDIAINGWKVNEPWRVEREQSQFHQVVFERLLEKDITPQRFAKKMSLPLSRLEVFMPIAAKFRVNSKYTNDEYSLDRLRKVDQGQHLTDGAYD